MRQERTYVDQLRAYGESLRGEVDKLKTNLAAAQAEIGRGDSDARAAPRRPDAIV